MINRTWLFVLIYDVTLMLLIGISIFLTKSVLPLMALIFLMRYKERIQ